VITWVATIGMLLFGLQFEDCGEFFGGSLKAGMRLFGRQF
jgi:hypothetical protein